MSSTTTVTLWPSQNHSAFLDRNEWPVDDLVNFLHQMVLAVPEADRPTARVLVPPGVMKLVYDHRMSTEEAALARVAILRQAVLTALQHEVDGKVSVNADDLRAIIQQSDALA